MSKSKTVLLLLMGGILTVLAWPHQDRFREWTGSVSKEPSIYVAAGDCSDTYPGIFSFYPKCSIQAALDAGWLQSGEWIVQLLPGVYTVYKPIEFDRPDTVLYGGGNSMIIAGNSFSGEALISARSFQASLP